MNNAVLSGTVLLSGYMYSAGQKVIEGIVVVDNVEWALVKLGVARPDVCSSLPKADACPNIGFTYSLDTRKFSNGPHVLGIQGVNDRGDYTMFPATLFGGVNVFVQN